ncbi:hypothetical protein HK101_003776 [Irineochytrium annulatum]|nr:hypothetical protein HK101_003776 [Irineochytrium annulatum]
MEYRFLGRSGLKVSALALGGWVTYGAQVGDDEVAAECLNEAYKAGINFFDNAEVYAGGKSETVMGKAIKKYGWKRSSYVITTKIYWGGDGVNEKGLSRKHIVEGTKASLARLQLDYVDVIFAHRPDSLTPMEEVVRAFNWVIDKGYAFYWGTSEWSAEQIMDAHRVAEKLNLIGPLCEQPQYHMVVVECPSIQLHRERFEKEYAPLYEKYRMGTTIWSPLASGVLTGKYNDAIPEGTRLAMKDNAIMARIKSEITDTEEGRAKIAKVRQLKPIADKLGCTQAQLALAWCLKNPNVSTVITGATKPAQVAENVKALAVVPKLTNEVMEEIEAILKNKPKADIARF